MRQRAIALGFPAGVVFSTGKVRNTAEEATEVAAMLGYGSKVMLGTPAFHMPSARHLFELQGFAVLPYAVDFQSMGAWAENLADDPLNYAPTANDLYKSSRTVREAFARTIYLS